MPLASGLCSLDGWTLDRTCINIPDDTPEETIDYWHQVAAELLFGLTGNRFGPSCPITVRRIARGRDAFALRRSAAQAGLTIAEAPVLAALLARGPSAAGALPAGLATGLAAIWPSDNPGGR